MRPHKCDSRYTIRSGKSSLVTFSDRMVLYYCQNSGLAMEMVCSRSRSLLCYNFRTRLHVHFLLVSQARPFPFRSADRFQYTGLACETNFLPLWILEATTGAHQLSV